ncbi:MAG: pyridoxamine 5'-phosphate oxidase family protein, partial [Veillonella sp.]|nr:pyridoxamine 5'-phosphate oxidase family protein [Veillonella sp.]
AIPINYFYDNETQKIYFHGAKAGHKVDALKASDKVCFTVYGDERIDESEPWAPYVQSAVVFGRCRLLEPGPESIDRLKEFAMKYYPDEALADDQIARNGRATQMFEITIEHMSGKQVQEK